MNSIFNQPDAVHHLTDWHDSQPWTTALVWLGLWVVVWAGVAVFATRVSNERIVQIPLGIASLIPAAVWGFTTDTVVRHIPSDTAVKWVIAAGVVAGIALGVWGFFQDSIGAAITGGLGVLVILYVGISEALTRIASGFPTSVAGLLLLVAAGAIILFFWARDH